MFLYVDGILLKHEEQHARADDEEQREVEDWRLGRHHDEALHMNLLRPGTPAIGERFVATWSMMIGVPWLVLAPESRTISNYLFWAKAKLKRYNV